MSILAPTTAEERRALDALYSVAYEELRGLAARVRRGSAATISATTLVNEAWAKLARSPGVAATSRWHFKCIVARAMRQVLVEAARRKHAKKRGGRDVAFVSLHESVAGEVSTPEQVLALNAALEELERLAPRQVRIVECRFFGGLDVAETAKVLQVSEATVLRDWRLVKAWLRTFLGPAT